MPATKPNQTSGVQWLSSKEMADIVEERARTVLNISGKAFARNRGKGDYANLVADDCPGIVELALLAPTPTEARPLARKKSARSR